MGVVTRLNVAIATKNVHKIRLNIQFKMFQRYLCFPIHRWLIFAREGGGGDVPLVKVKGKRHSAGPTPAPKHLLGILQIKPRQLKVPMNFQQAVVFSIPW